MSRREEHLEVWCDQLASSPADAARLLDALATIGIETYPAPASARGSGLVLFDAVTPEVRSRIRERSAGGTERVIAVAMQRDALGGGVGWELLHTGASDALQFGDPAATADALAARLRRWQAVDHIVESPLVEANLAGESAVWRTFLRRIVEVAKFSTMPILIRGESGTGKELVARLIHTLDARPDKKELVVLDCTTVVPELSGSEFFGHERGAYTGAAGARDGAFALADGGTLFLDEVGELPLRLQAELLRVVQEGTYKRVGGNTWQRTRFRLVCATHRDLEQQMQAGRFRRDFYYRIAAWTCRLPSLRERRDDVPALVRHFLRHCFQGRSVPPLEAAVAELFVARDYPGNVRDLRHLVECIAWRHVGDGPITLYDVPEEERPDGSAEQTIAPAGEMFEQAARLALHCGMGLKEISNAAADASVRLALDIEHGNVGRAAERLGITDRGLQKRRALWRRKEPDGDATAS
ncbi:MAG: sigma-54-dependent transcriptional regulator [Acidobacteria bacterium]|nr:sigma-54-dependent transcriptional regulator [Acidobacteriota bacterium]